MAVAKKITVPFANTGDKIEIPLGIQANGSVSREKGFTDHYELEYDNPNAKDIERTVFNQIEFEQDSAIAEIQQHGISVFSNEDEYSYPKGSMVYYDEAVYQSLTNENAEIPTSDKWDKILTWSSVKAELDKLIPVGTTFIWDFDKPPEGYLFKKGQVFSATQYPKLAQLFPTLKLPDFRGVVPRGLDDGRGFDVGRALLSYQEDAIKNFNGAFGFVGNGFSTVENGIFKRNIVANQGTPSFYAGTDGNYSSQVKIDFSSQIQTANELRVKNIATNFIIKAG